MEDEAFWTSLAEGAGVWRIVLVGVLVTLIVFFILRMAVGPMADRRTRRILEEGMKDDDRSGKQPPGGDPPPTDPGNPPPKRGDGETR